MEPRDIVLLTLRECGGAIAGKTKLQKAVYFTGILSDHEDDLGYEAHYYGPYSAAVDEALYDLAAIGLIERQVHRTGQAGHRGFEKVRYDYRLTPAGQDVVEQRAQDLGDEGDGVAQAVSRLGQFGDRHYMRLAAAAKLQYLVEQSEEEVTTADVQQMARDFGWDLSEDDISDAIDYLTQLGLIDVVSESGQTN
jgi:uncharacterized protein YwgA